MRKKDKVRQIELAQRIEEIIKDEFQGDAVIACALVLLAIHQDAPSQQQANIVRELIAAALHPVLKEPADA